MVLSFLDAVAAAASRPAAAAATVAAVAAAAAAMAVTVSVPPAPRLAQNTFVPSFPHAHSPTRWWCDAIPPVVPAAVAAVSGVVAARSTLHFFSSFSWCGGCGAGACDSSSCPAPLCSSATVPPDPVPFAWQTPPSVSSFGPRSLAKLPQDPSVVRLSPRAFGSLLGHISLLLPTSVGQQASE